MIEVLSVQIDGGFTALSAPAEVCAKSIRSADSRFPSMYICGNHSSIIDRIDGNLHIRRGFTIHQVMEILLNSYEDTVFIEHDPLLFEDCSFYTLEDFVMLLRQIGRDRLLIYLTTERDRIFDFITNLADRYIYVEEDAGGYYIADVGVNGLTQRFYPKISGQLTLEVF
ncbi:hypothetical protein [Archaeoglobus neptunius]|uniref:hypothetical protein n=1 Tax=Archaeoglobus neptunius TaxID=2798580 RepID=UPI001928755C|nr:hypothetical protein [Archaeoglobus neptunius]